MTYLGPASPAQSTENQNIKIKKLRKTKDIFLYLLLRSQKRTELSLLHINVFITMLHYNWHIELIIFNPGATNPLAISASNGRVYGDVYLYHDTHLHPSKLFFLRMYHLTHTTNMYLSNTHTFSSSYLSYRQSPTYSMIQAIYHSILGGPIYMISSCFYDIISSTF